MEDRRIRRTRNSIYTALATLLTEKDVHQIKVKELCERADINKSTFYLHFLDIYDCKEKWLEEIFGEMIDTSDEAFIEKVVNKPFEAVQSIVEFFDRDVEFYRKLLSSPFASEFCLNLKLKLGDLITRVRNNGKPYDRQTGILISFIVCGTIDACVIDLTYYKSEDVNSSLEFIREAIKKLQNDSSGAKM
ncbi:MAG: TetR/AcrR family transcriptional regulator [Clostridia bacterium]|nr:TetR/AcrR family transcriptional regulator [Clostridia bacterium]MBR5428760.1 TetR/AcrR family transcriptional regulator [Clostridia bacterium]